ncbi:hypothetical protein [Enterobacter cloacae]|uniref:hypothetical protein n=1 Tax=Enterobacter cloacae TaxID=550 RepID=UPI0031813728
MTNEQANPGLTDTIMIPRSYISDMAHGFSEAALTMAATLGSDPHEAKRNVVYTNSLLAIELYFKSKLVIRKFEPANAVVIDERTIALGSEEQVENGEANIQIMHSTLQMPIGKRTHDIHTLFNELDEEFKITLLNNIINETPLIEDMKGLDDFIFKIKNYFVAKRYAFNYFIEAVPPDANYMYVLIPVLRGIRKTFGYREE